MRRIKRPVLLLAAVLAVPGAAVSIPAAAAEGTAPPAVEAFAYPDAAKILAEQNLTVKTGDGNIRLADCTSESGLVRIVRQVTSPFEVCFKVTGPSGYLALETSNVINIKGDSHAIRATLNSEGTTSSIDIKKNEWTPVGEADNSTGNKPAVLLELIATDGTPAVLPAPEFPAVGSLSVGAPGRAGSRGCTGTLVDPLWVLTTAGCFTDNPGTLAAGAPATKSTFIGGGHAVDIAELVPRTDRDVVMARLATPITDVTPLKPATAAVVSGTAVKVAGYGRTTSWGTGNGPRTTSQTVGTVSATDLDLSPAGGAAPVCAGDTGAPLVNAAGDITGLVSRAWQAGCLGTTASETRTSATAVRVDDLAGWADRTRRDAPSGTELKGSPYSVIDPATGHSLTFVQDSSNHLWTADPQGDGWHDLGTYAATSPTAIVNPANQHVVVYVNGPNNRLWSYDRTTAAWTQFVPTPSNTVLAPTAVPHTVVDPANGHLVTYIKDTAAHLWSVDPQGEGWHDFGALAATDPIPVVNPNDGHVVIYVNGPDNRLNTIDRRGVGRTEYTATTSGTALAGDAVPSVVVNPANGHFTAFIRDTANHLWSVDPWGAGWRDHGVMAATDPVATVDPAANRVVVNVNGPDFRLNSLNFATGAWTLVPASPAGKAMAGDSIPNTVVDPANKHLITFVRDNHNTLWSYDPNGTVWTRVTGGPSAV
ncbi:trypsin-like serine protease [Kitasatospora griseola]|uniref:trypsin-like serine protease n=1 Tax=Kitasatospora griseola TaxID=2064 RepID=UPI0036DDC60C